MKLIALLSAVSAASATMGRHNGWSVQPELTVRSAMAAPENALIAFIEPSTSACKALQSEWATVEEASGQAANVDCTRFKQLCKDKGVISYPAIRLYDGNGKATPYRGPRTASAMLSYLKRAERPAVTTLEDEKAVTAFQGVDEDVVVMAQLHPTRDAHLQTLFAAVAARHWDRASFGTVSSISPGAVVCYNNRDRAGQPPTILQDMTAVDAIPNFVEKCMAPLIGEFSRRTEGGLLNSGKSLVYYFAETPAEREAYAAAMRAVARKYEEYLLFVTVDAGEYADMLPMLGLRREVLPAVAVQNPSYGQVFPYDQANELSAARIEQFVTQIASGKVTPWDGTPPPAPASSESSSSSPSEAAEAGEKEGDATGAHDEL
ncbi:uncharacterized protein PG998_010310 [Apiospora kogelbergensis]|uniref:uncharacterized protein n=1 Tax=Apiospora kogelbergensis TaxID=1337665 RepID=UPI00312EDFC2